MNSKYQLVSEAISTLRPNSARFVIHKHNPRSGSLHYDLRFLDPNDEKKLYSFAFGSDFEKKLNDKIAGVRTKDHDPRWLDLKSYRLEKIDDAYVWLKKSYPKYFELDFNGKVLKGSYKLFKIKSRRDDQWLLIKSK